MINLGDENASIGTEEFARLGLLANPFRTVLAAPGQTSLAVSAHAAAMSLAGELIEGIENADNRPVWIEKAELPSAYTRFAISELLAATNDNASVGLLVAFVPFEIMRVGRLRAPLEVLSDRLASPSLPRTLAAWVSYVLSQPEAQEADLSASLVAELIAQAKDAPTELAERFFGGYELLRDDPDVAGELLKTTDLLRVPEPLDDSVFGVEAEEDEAQASPEAPDGRLPGEDEDVLDPMVPIRLYLLDWTRENVSPVLARGLRAYIEHGSGMMSQELKITKAPKKTLLALCRFAMARFERVVFLYDNFEAWPHMQPDMRVKMSSGLSQIRWALDGVAVMAVAAVPGQAPELEEQFSGGRRVDWTFSEVEGLESADAQPALRAAVAASARPGREVDVRVYSAVEQACLAAPDSLEEAVRIAADEIDELAARN